MSEREESAQPAPAAAAAADAPTPADAPSSESREIAPAPRRDDLDRAVIQATAVLQALAENQRALRESVGRAERTELLLQNVSGLNETFRAVTATQTLLLDAVQAAARERAEVEERARRARRTSFLLGVAFLGASGLAIFAVAAALQKADDVPAAVAAALKGESERRAIDRREEVLGLSTAFHDALSDRKQFEDQLAAASARVAALEADLSSDRELKVQAESSASVMRRQLDQAVQQVAEYQERIAQSEVGIQKIVELLDQKKRSGSTTPLDPRTALAAAALAAEGVTSRPAEEPPASAPAPAPLITVAGGVPVPAEVIREVNALLTFGSRSEIRLVEAGARLGREICDAYFTRYNERGRPSGFVAARRATFEESPVEPRLRLRLIDGYELTGNVKVPFELRTIELRSVDPRDWGRRLPELIDAQAARPSGAGPSSSEPLPPKDPQRDAVIERLNAFFAAHTEYGRYRIESLVAVTPNGLEGILLAVVGASGEAEQYVQARRATLTYVPADKRLEIDLEEGTRGRERLIPFPGGKHRLLIPGVLEEELAAGEPALPLRRR